MIASHHRRRLAGALVALVGVLAFHGEAHVSGPGSISVLSRHYQLRLVEGPSMAWGEDGPGDYYLRLQRQLAARSAGLVADLDALLAEAARTRHLALAAFDPNAPALEDASAGPLNVSLAGGDAEPGHAVSVTVTLAARPRPADVAWLRRRVAALIRKMPPPSEVANLDSDDPLVGDHPVDPARRLVPMTPQSWSSARVTVELRPYHLLDPATYGAGVKRLAASVPGALEALVAALEEEGLGRFAAVAADGEALRVEDMQLAGLVAATVKLASVRDEAARDAIRTRLAAALHAGAALP